MDTSVFHLFPGVVILVGLILGAFSVSTSISDKYVRRRCTAKTQGVVTDMLRTEIAGSFGEAPQISWNPVFTYNADGQVRSNKSRRGSSRKDFDINQNVTVFFDPANPDRYYVEEAKPSNVQEVFTFASLFLICLGLAYALVFFFLF